MNTSTYPVTSPLVGNHSVSLVKTIDASDLIAHWKEVYHIDISEELSNVTQIRLYYCEDSGLEFFYPDTVAGSSKLYEQLEHFSWYYMAHKWEHNAAIADIKKSDKVLEIGCGRGDFVNYLVHNHLADATGIELNQRAVKQAIAADRPVKARSLEDMRGEYRHVFDVVCSFQVLEHIAHPREFISACLDLLKPNGLLLFSVPNNASFIRYAQFDLLNLPPHHMTRWFPKTLYRLPSYFPMKLSRIAYEPLADYHLDWYLSIQLTRLSWLPRGQSRLRSLIKPILKRTKLYRLLRGHTMYAAFEKTDNIASYTRAEKLQGL